MDKEKLYDSARNLYEEELAGLIKKGISDEKTLEMHYKLLDCILDTYKICEKDMEMEEGSYESDYSGRRYMRSRQGNQGGGRSSYGNYSRNGYYNSSSRNSVADHIQTMLDGAKNDSERMMYQRWLDEAMRTVQ